MTQFIATFGADNPALSTSDDQVLFLANTANPGDHFDGLAGFDTIATFNASVDFSLAGNIFFNFEALLLTASTTATFSASQLDGSDGALPLNLFVAGSAGTAETIIVNDANLFSAAEWQFLPPPFTLFGYPWSPSEGDLIIINGTSGGDTITGSSQVDHINGLDGNDALNGGSGADTLAGGAGNDVYLLLADASDVIVDASGIDTIASTISRSLASYAAIEKLTLLGSRNIDATGNGLANTLIGNSGINTITGGLGRDTMTGGTQRDIFDFNLITETGRTASTRDRITDFTHKVDDIDLRTIDANTKVGGNQNFKFIGTQGFHHKAGELHYRYEGASRTIVEGDVNGDGRADFMIELTGHKVLTAGDFFL